jgi:hypothetical protein
METITKFNKLGTVSQNMCIFAHSVHSCDVLSGCKCISTDDMRLNANIFQNINNHKIVDTLRLCEEAR